MQRGVPGRLRPFDGRQVVTRRGPHAEEAQLGEWTEGGGTAHVEIERGPLVPAGRTAEGGERRTLGHRHPGEAVGPALSDRDQRPLRHPREDIAGPLNLQPRLDQVVDRQDANGLAGSCDVDVDVRDPRVRPQLDEKRRSVDGQDAVPVPGVAPPSAKTRPSLGTRPIPASSRRFPAMRLEDGGAGD